MIVTNNFIKLPKGSCNKTVISLGSVSSACSAGSAVPRSAVLQINLTRIGTRAYLLYHRVVRLVSVPLNEESTIKKARDVVDLLTEKRDFLRSTCFRAQTEQRTSPASSFARKEFAREYGSLAFPFGSRLPSISNGSQKMSKLNKTNAEL